MKYLLDTHILIWWLIDSPKLSNEVKTIIEENEIFISDVSFFEIVIKRKKGKLNIQFAVDEMMETNAFTLLPISTHHILKTESFSSIHGDPFDRLLAAQSSLEEMVFITHDKKLWKYPIPLLRA